MNYTIRHVTRFYYSAPIYESVMELYMQPRTEGCQRALRFDVTVMPRVSIQNYRDYLGNVVNHFDVPRPHTRLAITADSLVEIRPMPEVPDALDESTWAHLDHEIQQNDFWDMLMPSHFVQYPDGISTLAGALNVEARHSDPLSLLRALNTAIYRHFDYASDVTKVDSPIDVALEARKGVCQDFSHIMTALVRRLGIPCRYVSGYLYTGASDKDRSRVDATHAWVEAWLPGLGWIGFDPTNNLIAGERHIRAAVGRDYADVPPTRGVFKGEAETELNVEVQVRQADAILMEEEFDSLPETEWPPFDGDIEQQQQQ
jgi:transglutaminase-like putative cysteine protease